MECPGQSAGIRACPYPSISPPVVSSGPVANTLTMSASRLNVEDAEGIDRRREKEMADMVSTLGLGGWMK